MSKNNHRAPFALGPRSVVLQFSTALAWTVLFLTALSQREFRRATEAGSIIDVTQDILINEKIVGFRFRRTHS